MGNRETRIIKHGLVELEAEVCVGEAGLAPEYG